MIMKTSSNQSCGREIVNAKWCVSKVSLYSIPEMIFFEKVNFEKKSADNK